MEAFSDMEGDSRKKLAARQALLGPAVFRRRKTSWRGLEKNGSVRMPSEACISSQRSRHLRDADRERLPLEDSNDYDPLPSKSVNSNRGKSGHDVCRSSYVVAPRKGHSFTEEKSGSAGSGAARRQERFSSCSSAGGDIADQMAVKQLILDCGSSRMETRSGVTTSGVAGARAEITKRETSGRVLFCSDCGQLGHESLNCESSVAVLGYDHSRARSNAPVTNSRDMSKGHVTRGSRAFDKLETRGQQAHPSHLNITAPVPGSKRRVRDPQEESGRHVKQKYPDPAHEDQEHPRVARHVNISLSNVKREPHTSEGKVTLSEGLKPSVNPCAPSLVRLRSLLRATTDAQVWVQETLKFFEQYRAYLMEIGQGRGDALMEARKFVIDNGLALNKTKRLGSVPGVEVGQEFQYRAELEIVGMHFALQSGIDTMADGGQTVAVSIVCSGGYEDNVDGGDIVEFTGQGGMVGGIQVADQQLVRGNKAMKLAQDRGYEIRVIRGTSHAGSKTRVVYTYAGLYSIFKSEEVVGRSGFKVWKFHLKRNMDPAPQARGGLRRRGSRSSQVGQWPVQ